MRSRPGSPPTATVKSRHRGRRDRKRDVLDRVPALPASPRADRCAVVISDAHEGSKGRHARLRRRAWQRCRVHFARNVLARVPKGHQDVVAAALRTVFVHPNPDEISAAWDRTVDMFARQFPKVKDLMDSAKGDVLAFSAFPPDHWRKLVEQPTRAAQQRDKGRTNVVQIFPDNPRSCASSVPCSPNNTTTGQPTVTTSPKTRWPSPTHARYLPRLRRRHPRHHLDHQESHR